MSEHRYSEAEAVEIFRRAAEAEQGSTRAVAPVEGLTLEQLQEIGREAGLDPEAVARAALQRRAAGGVTVSVLGLPLGVGRSVDLGRSLSDPEWEQLVSELRVTFEARGSVRYDGPFRQWSNGNLHVLVEPTPTGHRVRMGTVNGMSRAYLSGGAAVLGVTVIVGVVGAASGIDGLLDKLAGLAVMGGAMLTVGAVRLPFWARRRLQQMDQVIARLAGREAAALPASDDA